MKYPWMQFFCADWMNDSAVSKCTPEVRGVWVDLLCVMHLNGRSGELCGTVEELARCARCSTATMVQALTVLQATGTADVTYRNTAVTVTNRRMLREHKERQETRLRVQKFRGKGDGNGPETKSKRLCNNAYSYTESESESETHTEQEVCELPGGFPKTVEEAVSRCMALSCPEAFVRVTWDQAIARCGRDSQDVPIRSWPHHVSAMWAYQQSRDNKPNPNGKPYEKKIQDKLMDEAIKRAMKSI